MKILSWNVNGLRAVCRRDFPGWLRKSEADIICLQEIKADHDQIPEELRHLKNYYLFSNPAQKAGYAGVAVFSKTKPSAVETKLGLKRFDSEGRFLKLTYSGFTLLNLYLPHGGRQKENLDYKLEVYDYLLGYLSKALQPAQGKLIVIGDFNIAHTGLDLARPKNNQKNTMFTPEERVRLDKLIDLGFTDTFRKHHQSGGNYTWWPYFANARVRNLGWRIDYTFVSKKLTPRLKNAFILNDVFGSDHCPVGIEITS
jgi:exodeoxyribonuclease-3